MSRSFKPGIESLTQEAGLYPQEKLLKADENKKQLFIGIPKESEEDENRICLTPQAVKILTNEGHNVYVETGAGKAAKFMDNEFSEAGARIVYSAKEAFEADIVLKVEPPTIKEISYMNRGATLISALQFAKLHSEVIKSLNEKKINGFAFEMLEDKAGGIPVVRAMSEIAGSTVMLIASEYLSSDNEGKGVILGGITGVPPTNVVIIGAGTVAEYAVRTAKGLGAEVKVFDNHIYKLRRLKHNLGLQIYTSTIDIATLQEALENADVVIGAIRGDDERSPVVVTEEMVSYMKPNSIIIDVSIDQGGCFETSEMTSTKKPVYKKYDVIHYCVPNIPSKVAGTATTALSNIFTPILQRIADCGGVEEMLFDKEWFLRGVYTYKGSVTNANIARKFNMKYKDLSLLLAARF